ncbi:MAG: hypothetical protein ACR2HR_14720 [Euzebya sp.]
MKQLILGIVVLGLVFGAGVLTGLRLEDPRPETTVAGDVPAVMPGSRSHPFSVGRSSLVGAWEMTVRGVEKNGTQRVLLANQFNTPPQPMESFVLIEVVLRRRSRGPGVVQGSISPALVTPGGREYALRQDCGVVPRALDVQQLVGEGRQITGQWCWAVKSLDLPKLTLRIAGTGGGSVWFSLE